MKYCQVLGIQIKDEFLLDLFETYDVEVLYIYDRTYEGLDDQYFAKIPAMGLEFVFDSNQKLETIFMKYVIHNGFNPFSGKDPRDVSFLSVSEALVQTDEQAIGVTHQTATSHDIFGEAPAWVKFEFESYYLHYQFKNDGVELVTLMRKNS